MEGNGGADRAPVRTTMRRGRQLRVRTSIAMWPQPPPCDEQHYEFRNRLCDWAEGLGCDQHRLRLLEGLLDRGYILSLPLPNGATGFDNPDSVTGNQLRYLFRRHSATILGWNERRREGARDGFPAFINEALRTSLYP